MRPGVEAVEFLLNNNVTVNVYSGQLDLIVDVLCTSDWINNGLTGWPGLPVWKQQAENPITIGGVPQGFVRSYQNFAFWKILRAGHMVPVSFLCVFFVVFFLIAFAFSFPTRMITLTWPRSCSAPLLELNEKRNQ